MNDLVQSLNVIPGLPPCDDPFGTPYRFDRYDHSDVASDVDHVGGGAQSPFYRQSSCLIVERATETARRVCSSRAMRCLHTQAPPDTEPCVVCTNSFQVCGTERCLPRSLTQETGVLPALGSLSRGRRVWMNSPCPRTANMEPSSVFGNTSFGHFLIPENLP